MAVFRSYPDPTRRPGSVDKDSVISMARAMIGWPWRYHGRSETGIDCVGLACVIAAAAGHPFADHTDYVFPPAPGQLKREVNRNMTPIGNTRIPGTVLLLADRPGDPKHCGIYTGSTLIHAMEGKGVMEHRLMERRPFRVIGAYSFKGVSYDGG